ncbi:Uncharacterized protein DBV15_10953 [Temnothorax longispinosus]|uniref:Uncharacterized protein n=1 Tax=Temnothorax longispinosus TaxID=300112 RepID=A0A4S2K4Z4_9HYME|nr:Uncharacterized protein DBV15_10953 [Temnothorax longispinosus]
MAFERSSVLIESILGSPGRENVVYLVNYSTNRFYHFRARRATPEHTCHLNTRSLTLMNTGPPIPRSNENEWVCGRRRRRHGAPRVRRGRILVQREGSGRGGGITQSGPSKETGVGRQSRGTRRAVRMRVLLRSKGVHKCVFAILLGLTRLISPPGTGNDVVVVGGGGAEMIARTTPIATLYVHEALSENSWSLVGGWTRQPLESPNPEESTKKPVITAVVIIAAGGAGRLPS